MANYVHRHSGCKGPFVAVHPASVSENLFENEFFGHEKGAFTGATGQKIGFFELADNGTLFIDEVGDIPMNMQIKLLRVLQEHRFMRVGGTKEIHSSFRLIAATNRDLPRAVREGTFREDLYYRISVIPVTIPPLRERLEDLEELIMAFTDHFSRRYGKKIPCPDKESLRRLSEYQWPGNIRELRNAVERAVILYTGGPFDLVLLDPPYAFGAEPVEELLQNLAQQGLLAPGAFALFEHAAADAGAHPVGFETVREKRYGITSVDLLRWVGDSKDGGTDANENDEAVSPEDAHE